MSTQVVTEHIDYACETVKPMIQKCSLIHKSRPLFSFNLLHVNLFYLSFIVIFLAYSYIVNDYYEGLVFKNHQRTQRKISIFIQMQLNKNLLQNILHPTILVTNYTDTVLRLCHKFLTENSLHPFVVLPLSGTSNEFIVLNK